MSHLKICALVALGILALAGCSSGGETRGSFDGASGGVIGGFVRGGDTYGTNRRLDVYGASTAPSLPTIGAVGYGK